MISNKRLLGLDVLKGLGIVLMIVYHFAFDLNHFRFLEIDFFTWFWRIFRYLIVTFFLFSVGVSLTLSHPFKINFNKVFTRIIKLGIAAVLVSIVSYYLFPDSWIYFGILHFIWLASILVLPVLFYPKIAVILALLIFSAYFLGISDGIWLSTLQPILSLPTITQDLVTIFPWLAMILLGVATGRSQYRELIFDQQIWQYPTLIHKTLAYLGRRALWVYLIHQPILFGAVYVATIIIY